MWSLVDSGILIHVIKINCLSGLSGLGLGACSSEGLLLLLEIEVDSGVDE